MRKDVKGILDEWVERTNQQEFIEFDPISIPHRFRDSKQNIEISGFFAAIMSWGNRKTIINKANELMGRMDNDPYQFVINSKDSDLKQLSGFVHRTMNETDVLYLVDFLKRHYQENTSLETAFFPLATDDSDAVYNGLTHFYNKVFEIEYAPKRTQKHISTPAKNSACKRLNMYLRWMVRKDPQNVDFGIWNNISSKHLICPLDVHVQRVALQLGLISRTQGDWKAAIILTEALRKLDPVDPIKYDYALFGLGVSKAEF